MEVPGNRQSAKMVGEFASSSSLLRLRLGLLRPDPAGTPPGNVCVERYRYKWDFSVFVENLLEILHFPLEGLQNAKGGFSPEVAPGSAEITRNSSFSLSVCTLKFDRKI